MNEETIAMFAEGTLTAEEARQVTDHVAGCDLCLSGVRAAAEHFREEQGPQRSHWWLAVAAIVGVVLAGAAVTSLWIRGRASSPVARLVALSPKGARPVEPRLSGGFAWAPYRGPVRGDDVANAEQMKLTGAAGELIEQAARDRSPDTQHAAAVAMVLIEQPQEAATRLRALAEASPSDPALWNDLAAAQSSAALRLGRPSLYPDALASADRALQLDPKRPEALFNRALIVERLGLAAEARAAWQRYLAVDAASPWANEARARLAQLSGGTSRFAMPDDPARARDAVHRFPQQSRTFAEGETLARWGDAVTRGDEGAAAHELEIARAVGSALREQSGEALLSDAVTAIVGGQETLARAHLAYRRGRIAYSRQRPADAEADLREAAREFERGGSPMALVARYYAANTRFDQNDVPGARGELRSLLTAIADRPHYIALRGQLQWELALCDAAEGDWNGALASLTAASDAFRRLGERSNEAFIDTLLAQALGELGRPDDEWAARVRSFAALAAEPGDRLAVSVNSAARSALRAGRRDAALALLRVFAETARTSRDDGLLADALLQQTLLERDDAGAANATLAEMARVAARVPDPRLRERAENDLAVARAAVLLPSQPREAEDLLTSAIAFYGKAGKPALLPEPYLLRARSRMRRGDAAGAQSDLDSGIAVVEAQRADLARGVVGTGVLDAGRALYEDAIAVSIERGDARAAFAYAERAHDERKPDLDALQRRLAGTRTAVLVLTPAPREVIDVVITADHVEAVRARRGDDLYDVLIRPAERLIANAEHLILVPDRTLAQVPFAALFDRAHGRFLIESHSISIARSASSLQTAEERVPRSAVAMMLPSGEATGTLALPEAAGELADVCASYASCATDRPATFAAMQAAAQRADVLHLAGHTKTASGETALVFGADRVSWRTIAATPFTRGGVVVLAACETLKASATPDDRAPSLGAAFAAAGAEDVIGTLTPIADGDARSLFRAIHRQLAAGASAAVAVQRAQLDALATDRNHASTAWQSIAVLTRRITRR